MSDSRPGLLRRLLPAGLAAVFFAFMTALYLTEQRPLYEDMLRSWGVDPFRFPFVDVETVLSAIRCMHEGVDVLKVNPCDPVRRVFDYSPLWLLLAYFPVTEAWTMPAGIFAVTSFIASLTLLPAGRTRLAVLLIALGAISPAVVFGAERGNNDLILFVLAAVAAALACRSPALRIVGYGAALLAGLLKDYPMTLLALATRERPARFFAVAAGCAVLLGAFLLTMGHELTRALKLIPGGGWFGDMFGSTVLGGGLGRQYGISIEAASALRIVLTVTAFGAGLILAFRQSMSRTLERLVDLERMALLAGGLLIISCFFTAQNIGYRAMHLVLTLPALAALSATRAGRVWTLTLWTTVLLLWAQGWRNWFFSTNAGRPMVLAGWFVREAMWWWTITAMIALVFGILVRSEMGRRLLRGLAPAAVIAFVIAGGTASLTAWGAQGHHIVARIAWAQMTPAVRERASALLDGGGMDAFVAAATWADEVRQDRPETYNWHFVNIHVSEGKYDAARHCPASDRGDCVIAAIGRLRSQLVDASRPAATRAEDLKFLIHFVGDLHQPLHSIDNKDRGGNDVRVEALRGEDGRATNLHAAWDTGMINLSPETETARAERLLIDLASNPASIDLDVVKWAEANHEVATKVVYRYPGFVPTGPPANPVVLDEVYRRAATAVIDRQLQLGGVRLAALLNTLLGK